MRGKAEALLGEFGLGAPDANRKALRDYIFQTFSRKQTVVLTHLVDKILTTAYRLGVLDGRSAPEEFTGE